jgi:hypothetical protein
MFCVMVLCILIAGYQYFARTCFLPETGSSVFFYKVGTLLLDVVASQTSIHNDCRVTQIQNRTYSSSWNYFVFVFVNSSQMMTAIPYIYREKGFWWSLTKPSLLYDLKPSQNMYVCTCTNPVLTTYTAHFDISVGCLFISSWFVLFTKYN